MRAGHVRDLSPKDLRGPVKGNGGLADILHDAPAGARLHLLSRGLRADGTKHPDQSQKITVQKLEERLRWNDPAEPAHESANDAAHRRAAGMRLVHPTPDAARPPPCAAASWTGGSFRSELPLLSTISTDGAVAFSKARPLLCMRAGPALGALPWESRESARGGRCGFGASGGRRGKIFSGAGCFSFRHARDDLAALIAHAVGGSSDQCEFKLR